MLASWADQAARRQAGAADRDPRLGPRRCVRVAVSCRVAIFSLEPSRDLFAHLTALLLADQRFRCRIKSTNLYGLYRHDDIDALLRSAECSMEPFVALDTIVVELMDLTTDKSQRHLTIRAPPPPPSKLELEIEELF